MDKLVRVNFFQVSNVSANDRTLYDALLEIDGRPDKDVYIQLSQGVNVRLERLQDRAGFLKGEIVRQQTDNLPPIAHTNEPLVANNNPLGHRSAFLYNPRLSVLAIEANRQGASPARMNQFIRRRIGNHRGFFFDPCLNEDALAQLRDGTPRQLQMRVARPSDLNAIAGNPYEIEESLTHLQEMVNGNMVSVEVGFERGNRDGVLNSRSITDLARWAFGNRHSVKKLAVKTLEDDVPIDLFGQQIFERETLDIDNDDVDEAYNVRSLFLRNSFQLRLNELTNLYGDGAI